MCISLISDQGASRAAFFSGRQRKNVLPCISQLLENASFHWLMGASQEAQMIKNLPAMWETWVRFLAWDDPLEEGIATHCSILAWRNPWTEEPGLLQSMGLQRVRDYWVTNTLLSPSQDWFNFIISAKSLLAYNLAYSYFPRIRILTFWGPFFLPTRGSLWFSTYWNHFF